MKCPGQDTQYWKPDAIFDVKCPKCGHTVEFFKDDTSRKCGHCGHRFINPEMDFGCASYCQFAEQCLGTLPSELLAQKEDLLKDRVAIAMKRHFKTDFARIGHATKVARYAERIGRNERVNMAVVLVASYLLEVENSETQKRENQDGHEPGEPQEESIARKILIDLKAQSVLIDSVLAIVTRPGHASTETPLEFKVVYDADKIASWEADQKSNPLSKEELEEKIQKKLLTESGRNEAKSVLINPAV